MRRWIAVIASVLVAGCASTSPGTRVIEPIEADLSAYEHVFVTVSAASEVSLDDSARERIRDHIVKSLNESQADWATAAEGAPLRLEVTITRYEAGDAFARAMLAGLGQMHIDGVAVVSESDTGARLGSYEASKKFAGGGLYGASVTIDDIEESFAESIAEGLRDDEPAA